MLKIGGLQNDCCNNSAAGIKGKKLVPFHLAQGDIVRGLYIRQLSTAALVQRLNRSQTKF